MAQLEGSGTGSLGLHHNAVIFTVLHESRQLSMLSSQDSLGTAGGLREGLASILQCRIL